MQPRQLQSDPPVESATNWPMPTLADVLKARRAIVRAYLRPTPSIEPPDLASLLGCRVVLKCENLNPTGAFKVRGGVNLVAAALRETSKYGGLLQPRRVITVSP